MPIGIMWLILAEMPATLWRMTTRSFSMKLEIILALCNTRMMWIRLTGQLMIHQMIRAPLTGLRLSKFATRLILTGLFLIITHIAVHQRIGLTRTSQFSIMSKWTAKIGRSLLALSKCVTGLLKFVMSTGT